MKIIQKSLAIIGYLLIIALLAKFQLDKLFDIRQIIVTCLGAYLLYIPAYGFSVKKKQEMLGQTALAASCIQTFVLLFFQIQNAKAFETLLEDIALNCRPLLYGFFLWIVLQDRGKGKNSNLSEEKLEEMTIEKMQKRLKEFGLTNREVEIALEVMKGFSNAEIAYGFTISETTVKKHISNIFEKMNIKKREQIKEKLNDK